MVSYGGSCFVCAACMQFPHRKTVHSRVGVVILILDLNSLLKHDL